MTKLLPLVAILIAFAATPTRADTPEQLIASWQALGAAPGACQEAGCEARQAIAKLIEERGYCYGPQNLSPRFHHWYRCKD
jgi:hypothetical protein